MGYVIVWIVFTSLAIATFAALAVRGLWHRALVRAAGGMTTWQENEVWRGAWEPGLEALAQLVFLAAGVTSLLFDPHDPSEVRTRAELAVLLFLLGGQFVTVIRGLFVTVNRSRSA